MKDPGRKAGGPDLYIKRHSGSGSDGGGIVSSGSIKEWGMFSSRVFYFSLRLKRRFYTRARPNTTKAWDGGQGGRHGGGERCLCI
jgi:hypothetical protein